MLYQRHICGRSCVQLFPRRQTDMVKNIPKVDKVLEWPRLRPLLLKAVRDALASLRAEVLGGEADEGILSEDAVADRVGRELALASAVSLKRVVNATGVVIHTNLGRSPLPESVRQSLNEIAFGYSNLEFDLEEGVRGSRYSHVERLLC